MPKDNIKMCFKLKLFKLVGTFDHKRIIRQNLFFDTPIYNTNMLWAINIVPIRDRLTSNMRYWSHYVAK